MVDFVVDDTRLKLAAACRLCGRHSPPCSTCFARGHKFERVGSQIEKTRRTEALRDFVVDDTRLELVTSRTSSGCATSCANRPSA